MVKKQHLAYRIIVVYNEPDFRKWVRSLLNKTSYFEVAEQARGDEAIFLIAPTKPDAIISDEHRSEPDGIDVARYVHHQLPGVKVILNSL